MSLLNHYNIASDDSKSFDVLFEIPENCVFNTTTSGDTSCIDITLKPGQTVPSTTYSSYSEKFDAVDGVFNLEFKETQGTSTQTRPKITIVE